MRRPLLVLLTLALAAPAAEDGMADPYADPAAAGGAPAAQPGSDAAAATPLPDATAQKAAIAELRKLYKDSYALKKSSQKRAFAIKLRELAKEGHDDAATRWAALSESEQLSIAGEDLAGTFDAIEALGAAFAAYDAMAERRAALAKLKQPAAKAMLTLLDKPLDPAANGEAGRYFCLEANRWDLGLPLLANGDDAVLAKLAARETEPPTEAPKQAELGDGWYDAAAAMKKDTYRAPAYLRAHHWYGLCLGALTGVAKERIGQREIEIFAYLPDDQRDYPAMTAKQWEKLKGPTVTVDARTRTDSKLSLKPGQKARVVPNPDDTWTFNWLKRMKSTVDWKGDAAAGRLLGRQRGANRANQLVPGSLAYQLDEGDAKEVKISQLIEGPGKLWLSASDPTKDAESGAIKCKLVVIDEE